MKRSRVITTIGSLAVLSLVVSACGGNDAENGGETSDPQEGGSQSGTELRISINQTDDHPNYLALDSFAEKVNERTDGRINMVVYPNAVLGEQQESVQLVSSGAVNLASISGPQMINVNEDFKVLDMPLVFDSVEHQMNVINDPDIVGDLYTSVEDSHSITIVGGYTQGARSIYNSQGPIVTPDDTQGMKIRVQESPLQIAMIEAMGASATPMAFGEVYTALQAGVIDGAENNPVSYVTQRHYEVAPYYSHTNHLIGVDYLAINTELFSGFSEEDQAIFTEEFLASVEYFTEMWTEQVEAAIAETEAAGAQFNEVDSEAFAEVLQPVVDEALETDAQKALFEAIRERA